MKWLTKVTDNAADDDWMLRRWGSFYRGGPQADHWIGQVSNAVLRVRVNDPTEATVCSIAERVHKYLPAWATRLRSWLEVLTYQDLDDEHPVRNVESLSAAETSAWTYRSHIPGDSDHIHYSPMISTTIADGPERPIDRATWLSAVRRTNRGVDPPLSHLLLRDARSAVNRNARRRGVLDAASAVEVTVTPLLHRVVGSRLNVAAADELVPQRRPISAKLPALKALGFALPGDLERVLFNVRNMVIHGGYDPTPKQARQALEAAAMVVARHGPPMHP